ncbi:MAG: lipoyl(octanoyl) transferase LipB [Chloroflexota bacterium]|nr:lipoyl(octanoyl) transferase LipB [Chloroflexota bacterium]
MLHHRAEPRGGGRGTFEASRVGGRGTPLRVMDLGRVAYADAMRLQDDVVEQRLEDQIPDTLLLLEHPPIVTLGRRGTTQDVNVSEVRLNELGIELHRATRGGLVTYHGPGQLVGYPIVKLRARGLTVPCYVRALELAIIAALEEIGVDARIDEQHVGVWAASAGKIGAIGVAQRHGVSLHGFAVNLQPDLSHFDLINACGIGALGVTSAAAILGRPVDPHDFKLRIARTLNAQLEAQRAC